LDNALHVGSDHLKAQVWFYLADVVLARGDRRTAEAMARDALRIFEHEGFIYGRGWCHFLLGWIALSEHKLDQAGEQFETLVHLAEEADDETMRAHVRPAVALVTALRGDHGTARTIAAEGIKTAEGVEGAPRVLMMALARAGQVAVVSDDPAVGALAGRLLRLLHNTGVAYWADTALELAAIGLAGKMPHEAAIALAASQSLRRELDDSGGEVARFGERVQRCRTHLIEVLGPDGWEAAVHRAATMTVEETITYALAALETVPA
jgi:tetratricopeptide (TPR) repeat protein